MRSTPDCGGRASMWHLAVVIGLVSVACLVGATPAAASSGLIDRSLGGGVLTFDLGPGDDTSGSIVLQPDGGIVFTAVTNDDGGP